METNFKQVANYVTHLEITTTAAKVFEALTQEIPLWWTEMFEGSASKAGETFTVRFGYNVYKTMQVTELAQNESIVWEVKQSLIDIPELKNQSEWEGTTIVWNIKQDVAKTFLYLEHIGLNENVECYEICRAGWQQFTNSLQQYLETGEGNPYKNMS